LALVSLGFGFTPDSLGGVRAGSRYFSFGSVHSSVKIRHPTLRQGGWVCEAFRAPAYILLVCGRPNTDRVVRLRDGCGDGVSRSMIVAGVRLTTDCEG